MLSITKIEEAIDAFIESDPAEDHHIVIPPRNKPRNYLGLSGLGDDCLRKVWYQWRKCFTDVAPPRMKRLWRRGDREEFIFVWLLQGIGFTVHETDENNKQFKVTDFGGHLSGHMDGVGLAPKKFWIKGSNPVPFLLEFKTYNDKRFNELRKGRVKKSDPKYYVQMQGYMGYENLKGALFCAVNKNDDTLYFEWVSFSKSDFESRVLDAAEEVLHAQAPPARLSETKSFWKCKYCPAKGQCHDGAPAVKSCHSCRFGKPAEGPSWVCEKGGTFGEVCKKYKDITR